MSAVFADTFFYLALLNEDDPAHERAVVESRVNRPILTSEFIFLELGNACARASDHADFLALVAGIRASSRTRVVTLDSTLLDRGLHLMRDRPGLVAHGLHFLCRDAGCWNPRSIDRRRTLCAGRIFSPAQVAAVVAGSVGR